LGNALIINNYRNVSSDFVQDYFAASSLIKGSSIYGEDIRNLENEMLGFNGPSNVHPPFNALLFLPFTIITYKKAFIIFGMISLILLLLINQLVVKDLELNGEWFLNFTCFTLCWYPFISCLGNGQSSMIIAVDETLSGVGSAVSANIETMAYFLCNCFFYCRWPYCDDYHCWAR
jgi:hypothetical protein